MADVQKPGGEKQPHASRPNRRRVAQPTRPRSLLSQITTVLVQPGVFFRTLPAMQESRQWLWVALMILALVGLSAVRRDALANAAPAPDQGGLPLPVDVGGFGEPVGGVVGGPVGGEGVIPQPAPDTSAQPDVSATWATALMASGGVILQWLVLSALLAEVSLLTNRTPRFDRNLHIAIWASAPLALMAGLQLLYYAAGGKVGEPGVAGLLKEAQGYDQMAPFAQNLLRSLLSRLTLFWLWSLILVYIGARQALGGKRWAVVIVLLVWVVALVVVPAVVDTLTAESAPTASGQDMPQGGEMQPAPEMPPEAYPSRPIPGAVTAE